MTNYSAAFTPLNMMVQSPDLGLPQYEPITATASDILAGCVISGPDVSRSEDRPVDRSLEGAMEMTLVPHESVLGLGPVEIPPDISYLGFHQPPGFTKPYVVIPDDGKMDELREELGPDEYGRLQAYFGDLRERGGAKAINALLVHTKFVWVRNLFEEGLEVHHNGEKVESGDTFTFKPEDVLQIDKSLVFARPE